MTVKCVQSCPVCGQTNLPTKDDEGNVTANGENIVIVLNEDGSVRSITCMSCGYEDSEDMQFLVEEL